MQPHEQRAVDEKNDLDKKIEKLRAFVGNDIYSRLDKDEQVDLRLQLSQMQLYSDTLKRRINRFNP